MIFVIFKATLAVYTLVWPIIFLDYSINGSPTRFAGGQNVFVFLSTWAYILLVIYLWCSLFLLLYMTYKHARNGRLRSIKDTIGRHHRLSENNALSIQGTEEENAEAEDTNISKETCYTSWYYKAVWVLHDMTSGLVPMVCVQS